MHPMMGPQGGYGGNNMRPGFGNGMPYNQTPMMPMGMGMNMNMGPMGMPQQGYNQQQQQQARPWNPSFPQQQHNQQRQQYNGGGYRR